MPRKVTTVGWYFRTAAFVCLLPALLARGADDPAEVVSLSRVPERPARIWVDSIRGTDAGERGNRKKPFREIGSLAVSNRCFVTNGALGVARPGDTIILSKGNFTNQTSIWCIPGLKIRGAGQQRTFVYAIDSDEYGRGGPVIVLANGSAVSDLTIVCSTNTAQAGIGTDYRGTYSFSYRETVGDELIQRVMTINNSACTNARVDRVTVASGRDCVYVMHTNACDVQFRRCSFTGNWDGGILFGNPSSILRFRHCYLMVDGNLAADVYRDYVDGFVVESGTAHFESSGVIAKNGPVHSYGFRNISGTVKTRNTLVFAYGSPNASHYGPAEIPPPSPTRSPND